MGEVRHIGYEDPESFTMKIGAKTVLNRINLGDNIAVTGTSLVNLERALTPNSRMGGHFVQGHVDGTGLILGLDLEGDLSWVKVKTTKELIKYIVPKGFIAVDEASLTGVDMFDDECFNFMLGEQNAKSLICPHISQLKRRILTEGLGQVNFEKRRMTEG
nr:riboflavin synthase [Ipomoea batatas]